MNTLGNVQKYPLGYNKYNGQAFQPYSAFGEEGYHHGILMTKSFAKNIFLEMEETRRGNTFKILFRHGMMMV